MDDEGKQAAFRAWHHHALLAEAVSSCDMDGETHCMSDGPPYVLTEDNVLMTEQEWKARNYDNRQAG